MADLVEVTRQGFGSKGKDSLSGAIFGFVLVALSCVTLFWNEGRAVRRYQDLKEGAAAFVNGDSSKVDPALEGKLVHLSGEAVTGGSLKDPEFGIEAEAIKIHRSVEMFQWVESVQTETKDKVGGGSETTKSYSYSQEWRNGPVDSSQFKVTKDHQNPGKFPYQSNTFQAKAVTLGAFDLPEFLISMISGGEKLPVTGLKNAEEAVKQSAQVVDGNVYIGNNPSSPAIGDIRVGFTVTKPGPISVVAQQSQSTLVPFQTKNGTTVELLERGIVAAEDMFEMARARNKSMTWIIRVIGFILLAVGFGLILRPIAVLASILPFLGKLVGVGTSILGFVLAGIVWTLVVAIAWIFYRPVLGITILVVTVGLIVALFVLIRRSGGSEPAPAPGVPGDSPPPLT